jgi:hypothetical protein
MFNFGGSKSKTESSSLGLGYGYSGSSSASDSFSRSRSVSGGASRSGESVAFADMFAKLYGGAGDAAGRASPVNEQAGMLFSGGTGFLDELGGGPEQDYLESRVTGANPLLEEQVSMLGEDLGSFFREELNPAIESRAIQGGTFGGGRQGVAQGRAAGDVAKEFSRGATELRSGDLTRRDAAARDLMAGRTSAAGTALQSLPGLFGIAQGGALSELAPYQMLAEIMGGPTVLGESESSQFGESSSDAIARAMSEAFGEDFSYQSSKSKGTSKSLSLGFG